MIVVLNVYIVPNAPAHTMQLLREMGEEAMEARNILFQKED